MTFNVCNTSLQLIVHVSDTCIENVHTIINECKKLSNVNSVIILPQQIILQENFIIEATADYPFILYYYPDLYNYRNINLQSTISNMIGVR